MKKSDVVRVLATDWERDTGWVEVAEILKHNPEPIEIVGFFIGWGQNKHKQRFLKLSMTPPNDDEGLFCIYIPKVCIIGKPEVIYGRKVNRRE